MTSFAERLEAARALIAGLAGGTALPPPPIHLVDQLAAAADDAHRLARQLVSEVVAGEPDAGWKVGTADEDHRDVALVNEACARLFVALGDCPHVCPHLKRGGPQPAWASLAIHRVECERCRHTYRRPPPGEEDRCDWCGQRSVAAFHPLAIQYGPVVVSGDACPDCAEVLERFLESGSPG